MDAFPASMVGVGFAFFFFFGSALVWAVGVDAACDMALCQYPASCNPPATAEGADNDMDLQSPDLFGTQGQGLPSFRRDDNGFVVTGEETYYVAIIDFLTAYELRKKGEHMVGACAGARA